MNYFPDELALNISGTVIELNLFNKELDFNGFFLIKDSYRTNTGVNYYGEDIFGNHIFISHPFHSYDFIENKTEISLTMGSTDYYYSILPYYFSIEKESILIEARGNSIAFKKEEYIRQMTLSEIEKELGYKIQLVADDE